MWTPAISSQLNEDEADGITDGIGWSAALRERKRDQVGFVHAYVSWKLGKDVTRRLDSGSSLGTAWTVT